MWPPCKIETVCAVERVGGSLDIESSLALSNLRVQKAGKPFAHLQRVDTPDVDIGAIANLSGCDVHAVVVHIHSVWVWC